MIEHEINVRQVVKSLKITEYYFIPDGVDWQVLSLVCNRLSLGEFTDSFRLFFKKISKLMVSLVV